MGFSLDIQICIYGLVRPCMACHKPLPSLPLPGDALQTLRAADRSNIPLTHFNRLSLSSTAGVIGRDTTVKNSRSAQQMTLASYRFDCLCEGRDNAMLYKVDPSGDAVAWSRGSPSVSSIAKR